MRLAFEISMDRGVRSDQLLIHFRLKRGARCSVHHIGTLLHTHKIYIYIWTRMRKPASFHALLFFSIHSTTQHNTVVSSKAGKMRRNKKGMHILKYKYTRKKQTNKHPLIHNTEQIYPYFRSLLGPFAQIIMQTYESRKCIFKIIGRSGATKAHTPFVAVAHSPFQLDHYYTHTNCVSKWCWSNEKNN